jgi:hypothetical protein
MQKAATKGWKATKTDAHKLKLQFVKPRDVSRDKALIKYLITKLENQIEDNTEKTLTFGECEIKSKKNTHEILNELNDQQQAFCVVEDEVMEAPNISKHEGNSKKRPLETLIDLCEDERQSFSQTLEDYIRLDGKLKWNMSKPTIPKLNDVAPQILEFIEALLMSGKSFDLLDWSLIGINELGELIFLSGAISAAGGGNEQTTKELIRFLCRKVRCSMNDKCKGPSFLILADILKYVDTHSLNALSKFVNRRLGNIKKSKI